MSRPAAIIDAVSLGVIYANAQFWALGGPSFFSSTNHSDFDIEYSIQGSMKKFDKIQLEDCILVVCAEQVNPEESLSKRILELESELSYAKIIEESYKIKMDSYNFLSKVFDTVIASLFVVSAEGLIVHLNISAEKLLGEESGDALGRPFFTIVNNSNGVTKEFEHFRDLESVEMEFLSSTGEIIFMLVNCSSFYTDAGNVSGFVCIASDISKLKDVSNELEFQRDRAELANQAKSQFLSNMSHEVRTPLNAIIGYTEVIEEDLEDKFYDNLQSYLKVMRVCSRQLLSFVNQVLDITNLDSKKEIIYITETLVKDTLLNLEQDIQKLIRSSDNEFLVNIEDVNLLFNTDHSKLKQVLINLCENAFRFTSNGLITLSVVSKGEVCEFSVSDTGCGIPLDKQEVIFERFGQAHDLNKDKLSGAGLGLNISLSLVKMLGGDCIDVESEVGKGSTFSFVIPNQGKSLSNKNSEEAVLLIVEDEPDLREYMKECLSDLNLMIVEACSSDTAIEMIKEYHPQIVLTDYHLPGLSGYQLISKILEIDPSTRIHVISGIDIPSVKAKCIAAGAITFTAKPFTKDQILQIVSLSDVTIAS